MTVSFMMAVGDITQNSVHQVSVYHVSGCDVHDCMY